ncbi:MAG: hypothetical protein AMXMBFR7_49070 [Planctomycetota bacterium]
MPDEIYQLITVLGQLDDHLGLANLFLLLKHDQHSQAELDRALKDGGQAAEATRIAAQLAGASSLR